MKQEKDITNKRNGQLTAIKPMFLKNGKRYWLFKCDCGREIVIRKDNFIYGHTISCGCKKKETTPLNAKKRWKNHVKVKKQKKSYIEKDRIKRIYYGMINRCYNKNIPLYKYYGYRNIKVCKEWRESFEYFKKWAISNGYNDNLTIDRIDVNGDYCPENCRWISQKEQARNKRNNVWITYNGEKRLLSDWLKLFNKSSDGYYKRRNKGYSDEDILNGWSFYENKQKRRNI